MNDASTPAGSDPSDLEQVLQRPAIRSRDRVPDWLLRAADKSVALVPYQRRAIIALVILLVAFVGAIMLSSTRVLREVIDALDVLSFVGLFLVNWIGNGGILVPVPGARFLGLLMIFQQAVIFPSWEVFAVSGLAMGLGLVSYYIAGARSAAAYERGDTEAAEQVLTDATASLRLSSDDEGDQTAPEDVDVSRRARARRRFDSSWKSAQTRAQPIIERRGTAGMFWLCFVPSPASAAAAFLGGAMHFGFGRFLLASMTSKYLLAGVIIVAAFIFSEQARSVELPSLG